MFGFANPLLLYGLLAIAVPIVIHLLMRQRPKPRPWAAMQWLRAAVEVAQRRYRLTNLLLLLMRCLIAMLIALAVARPSILGLGQGGNLVLVVDASTSMGTTKAGSQLAEATDQLEVIFPTGANDVRIISIGEDVLQRYEGNWEDGLEQLANLEVGPFVGGLDSVVDSDKSQRLLDMIPTESSIIILSDFRQDRGDKLVKLLENTTDDVQRLRIGNDQSNGFIQGVKLPSDIRPGVASTMQLQVQGDIESLYIQIDDGPEERIGRQTDTQGDWETLTLPPLKAGRYLVTIRLDDQGLLADNTVEFPVVVRDRVQALVVTDRLSFVDVALEADPQRIDHRRISASALSTTPLPEVGGVLLLKSVPVAEVPLVPWLEEGGILWSDWDTIQAYAPLAEQVDGALSRSSELATGRLQTGMKDLDENFARTQVEGIGQVRLAENTGNILLRADDAALVVAMQVGRGWLVIESEDLSLRSEIRTTGALPEWTIRTVREFTAQLQAVEILQTGAPLPLAHELQRNGQQVALGEGQAAHLSPGWWSFPDQPERGFAIVPSAAEGVLRALPESVEWSGMDSFDRADSGADWSWWILLSLLIFLISEGAVASWAGRTYGR